MKSTFRGRTRRSNRSPAGTVVLFILMISINAISVKLLRKVGT